MNFIGSNNTNLTWNNDLALMIIFLSVYGVNNNS